MGITTTPLPMNLNACYFIEIAKPNDVTQYLEWLNENIGEYNIDWYYLHFIRITRFFFVDEEKAMAFKLMFS